jgi:hypothetical protein
MVKKRKELPTAINGILLKNKDMDQHPYIDGRTWDRTIRPHVLDGCVGGFLVEFAIGRKVFYPALNVIRVDLPEDYSG